MLRNAFLPLPPTSRWFFSRPWLHSYPFGFYFWTLKMLLELPFSPRANRNPSTVQEKKVRYHNCRRVRYACIGFFLPPPLSRYEKKEIILLFVTAARSTQEKKEKKSCFFFFLAMNGNVMRVRRKIYVRESRAQGPITFRLSHGRGITCYCHSFVLFHGIAMYFCSL